MFTRLTALKVKGYTPNTILDIGANVGNWTKTMKTIYGDAKYHLFEGIDYEELAKQKDYDTDVHIVVLNDKIDTVNWYEMRNTGDSFCKEKSKHFINCKILQKQTIDLNTYMNNNNILQDDTNIFIKIDCQGAEIPILKGATNLFDRVDFILLEIPLFGQYNEGVPTFQEHIVYMESIGFIPYDAVENHYMNNFNMQIDMLFINKSHPFNTLVNSLLL